MSQRIKMQTSCRICVAFTAWVWLYNSSFRLLGYDRTWHELSTGMACYKFSSLFTKLTWI